MNSVFITKVTGTGAALNVKIGWVPDYVRVLNITDADRSDEWFRDGMANGASIPTGAQVGAAITTGGISALDSKTEGKGITLGATVSESGKDLAIFAARNI